MWLGEGAEAPQKYAAFPGMKPNLTRQPFHKHVPTRHRQRMGLELLKDMYIVYMHIPLCLAGCLAVSLSLCLSIHPSLSIYLSTYRSICLSLHLTISFYLSTCLPIFVYLSDYLHRFLLRVCNNES